MRFNCCAPGNGIGTGKRPRHAQWRCRRHKAYYQPFHCLVNNPDLWKQSLCQHTAHSTRLLLTDESPSLVSTFMAIPGLKYVIDGIQKGESIYRLIKYICRNCALLFTNHLWIMYMMCGVTVISAILVNVHHCFVNADVLVHVFNGKALICIYARIVWQGVYL
jgi:hypothetical protein